MSDDEVPPPYSEQELDQKIARALVVSVQQHQASQQDLTDDGEWEQWDEVVFTAAQMRRRNEISVGSNSLGSSGSHTCERHESHNTSSLPVPGAVQPLRIHKRGGSGGSGVPGSRMGDTISEEFYESNPSGRVVRNGNERRAHHSIPPDSNDEDHSILPPPFASVDLHTDRIVRLGYHSESMPPSSLKSPEPDHYQPFPPDHHLRTGQNQLLISPDSVHLSSRLGTASRLPRQSLPIPPRSPNYHASAVQPHSSSASPYPVPNHQRHPSPVPDRVGQPTTSTHPSVQTQSPHGVYLSAYKKTASAITSQSQSFAANALYHSSVSGHLLPPTSMPPRVSHSSRQHRPLQTAQLQPPQPTTRRTTDQTSNPAVRSLNATSANYLSNQPMPNIHPERSSLPQHITNATYFPQHPTFPTQYGDPTIPRWATSERQLNQNFQY